MSREHKFRAYNKKTKTMWWFDLTWGNTDTHGSGWIGMLPIGETKEHSGGINGSDNRTQVDPSDCEIMDYIGRRDKAGVEICEGDIIKELISGSVQVVTYEDIMPSDDMTAPGVGYQFNTEPGTMLVVGNIYENLDLLVQRPLT